MSRRRRPSTFEGLIKFATTLPYWLNLIFAVVSYFLFNSLANQSIDPVMQEGSHLPQNMLSMLLVPVFTIFQFLIPLAFLIGAAVSGFKDLSARRLSGQYASWRRSHEESNSSKGPQRPTDDMNWQQFELLVGEAFRKQGYRVIHGGDTGADGGVDVHLRKDGQEFLVQCKHWKTKRVGVAVVRELYGVMASVGAAGGFIVTSGTFTEEAVTFSEGTLLKLVDGQQLSKMLGRELQSGSDRESAVNASTPVITCPKCDSPMVKRQAKRGLNAGNDFWGCSRFPKCRGTLDFNGKGSVSG